MDAYESESHASGNDCTPSEWKAFIQEGQFTQGTYHLIFQCPTVLELPSLGCIFLYIHKMAMFNKVKCKARELKHPTGAGKPLTKHYRKVHWSRTNLLQQKSLLHLPTPTTKCALSGRLTPSSYITNKNQ